MTNPEGGHQCLQFQMRQSLKSDLKRKSPSVTEMSCLVNIGACVASLFFVHLDRSRLAVSSFQTFTLTGANRLLAIYSH